MPKITKKRAYRKPGCKCKFKDCNCMRGYRKKLSVKYYGSETAQPNEDGYILEESGYLKIPPGLRTQ